jgi:DNA-binding transcriptional MerR regulator
MALHHMQIGEVAERTGLSLRSIRYYEELGLVTPSARSAGGFRLYAEEEVARLRLIARMKLAGFSLEETKEVLGLLDRLRLSRPGTRRHEQAVTRLREYRDAAEERVHALREQLHVAEGFAADLKREVSRQKRLARRRG